MDSAATTVWPVEIQLNVGLAMQSRSGRMDSYGFIWAILVTLGILRTLQNPSR